MNTKLLKQKILDLAIRGKLTQQLKSDGTARDLLKQISEQKRESSSTLSSPRRRGSSSAQSEKTIIPLDKSEAPFEIPANWEWVCVDAIASLITDGEHLTPRRVESFEGYYLLSARNIQDNAIHLDDVDYVDDEEYNRIAKRCNPRKNDVLISCSGSIGRVAVVKDDNKYVMVRSAAMIRPVLAHSYYLMYALQSNCLQNQIQNYSKQTAQANLFQAAIRALQIPLPPLAEQQRIVAKIEEAFAEIDSIENNKELLKTHIKQTRQKILDLAIHGKLVPQNKSDEPASVLLERITRDNPHYEKLADVPFEIPESWEWVKLGDVVKQVTDFVASGSFASLRENVKYYKEENYAILVRTLDFRNNFEKDLTYTDKHGYEFLSNSNLFGGELLLSNIGSIGKVFIVPKLNKRMTLAPNSIMVRHYDDSQRDWLYYFFLSPVGQEVLLSISSSTTQAKFNKTQLKGVLVPLPPLAEQKRIVDKIEEIFASLDDISLHLV
jgi:type I restriction enzyme S subunit